MSKIKSGLNYLAGWIVVRIPFLSTSLLMGRPLAKWYHTNGVMRFKVGQELEVTNPYAFGYGIRPTAKVIRYHKDDGPHGEEDGYVIEMTSDSKGNYHSWCDSGWIPSDVERVSEIEHHFKWNIEHQFRAVKKGKKARMPTYDTSRGYCVLATI